MALTIRTLTIMCTAVALSVAALAATASCTSSGNSPPTQPPVRVTSTMTAHVVSTPQPMPNLHTLDQWPPTSGNAVAGSFAGHAGDVWISFNCLGAGTATVTYAPVGSFDVPCNRTAVNATRNKIHFAADHTVTVRITAPASVRWALLVQQ